MAEQQRQQTGQDVSVGRSQQGKPSSQAMGQPSSQEAGAQSTGMQRQQGGGQLGRYGAAGGFVSPFTMMRRMMEDMDRMFDDLGFGGMLSPFRQPRSTAEQGGGRGLSSFGGTLWSPHIEVGERGGQLVVKADLPGVTKDDIRVQLHDDALIIEGERRQEQQEQREGVSYTERSYGSFMRSIPLPEGVQADDVDARFENGVLEVCLKLPQQQRRGRSVEIKGGGGSAAQMASGQGASAGGGQTAVSGGQTVADKGNRPS
ncbi:Hsp20/alpha crystallin family protein [Sorangium sp. So ce1182]|uniref:Hsp20/alpha crystallin family protein n=1 Tax=Sorangium sp. So ce1182 TaxID=3133334 RepID=UPI003F5F9907